MQRLYAYLASAVCLGLVLWPLSWKRVEEDDSYPLSTYPMFSAPLFDDVVPLALARVTTSDGRDAPLPPRLVANDEVVQSATVLYQTVDRGEAACAELCARIASRVAVDHEFRGASSVAIVTRVYHAVDYFARHAGPFETRVHARCPVPPADTGSGS